MTISSGTPLYAVVGKPVGAPPGMGAVLSGNTIHFTGTPSKSGTFHGTIVITDSAGFQITKKYTIVISAALAFSPSQSVLIYLPGKSYSQTFKTTGGTGARIVSYVLSGPLPAGLTISPPSPATGNITISGKTSVKTKVKITMTVTDDIGANNHHVYAAITLTIRNCGLQVSNSTRRFCGVLIAITMTLPVTPKAFHNKARGQRRSPRHPGSLADKYLRRTLQGFYNSPDPPPTCNPRRPQPRYSLASSPSINRR